MFKFTTAIRKIRAMKARKKVIQGGSSAGKTYGILPVLIDRAIKEPGLEISVVSESIPHLRRGALKDFLKIMRQTGRYVSDNYNKSLLTYTFSNGSVIEFFSADMEDKLRGARRTILYVNECNNVSFEAYHQLAIRTEKDIYLDFNPSSEFWAHTEVLIEPDAELLILTYEDNEALPDNVIQDFENAIEKAKTSEYWANWVKVYVYGQIGSLQGVIFDNWQTVKEIPKEARLAGIGIDFGYTHPAAGIALWIHDGKPIFDQVFYAAGQNNKYIIQKIKDYAAKHKESAQHIQLVADSAEPKSIGELEAEGFNVDPANKGADSVFYGLQLMQQIPFYITEDSTDHIKEARTYKWATTKDGTKKEAPVKAKDDAMDAARYIYEFVFNNKYSGNYTIGTVRAYE